MKTFRVLVIVGLVVLVKCLIQTTSSGKATEQNGSKAIEIS